MEHRDVKNYEGLYTVTSNGVIKSRFRTLKAGINQRGYREVNLSRKGKQRVHPVHRVIASAFLPLVEGKNDVNHLNGIKTDNRVENLEWCTKSENAIHQHATGLATNHGVNSNLSKLNEEQVLEIRRKYKKREYPMTRLGKEMGVDSATIWAIVQNRTWKHLLVKSQHGI